MALFQNKEVRELFERENGDRHRRLDEMRMAGPAFVVGGVIPAEFDVLYAEEKMWLKANGIEFSPSKGWHFIN